MTEYALAPIKARSRVAYGLFGGLAGLAPAVAVSRFGVDAKGLLALLAVAGATGGATWMIIVVGRGLRDFRVVLDDAGVGLTAGSRTNANAFAPVPFTAVRRRRDGALPWLARLGMTFGNTRGASPTMITDGRSPLTIVTLADGRDLLLSLEDAASFERDAARWLDAAGFVAAVGGDQRSADGPA